MPTSFFAKAQPGKKSVPIKWRDSAWPVRVVIRSAAGRRGPLARWARDTGAAPGPRAVPARSTSRKSEAPDGARGSCGPGRPALRQPVNGSTPWILSLHSRTPFFRSSRSDNFFEL